MELIAPAFSARALVSWRLGTSWAVSACRAGIANENNAPWATAAIRRWYQAMTPAVMLIPTNTAINNVAICPAWTTRLRGNLSAIAPPKSGSASIGTAEPALTTPSKLAESVRS